MNKFINLTDASSSLYKELIDTIIEYCDVLYELSTINFTKKISTMIDLTNNRIAIGYYNGGISIYNLENGTQIVNALEEYTSEKNYITSMCQFNDNIVGCTFSNNDKMLLWDFENNSETKLSFSCKPSDNLINLDHTLFAIITAKSDKNSTCIISSTECRANLRWFNNCSYCAKFDNLLIVGDWMYIKIYNMGDLFDEVKKIILNMYPTKIVPIDSNNYIIAKTDNEKSNSIEIIDTNDRLGAIDFDIKGAIDDIVYINNRAPGLKFDMNVENILCTDNLVILSNSKVYICDMYGRLLQKIGDKTTKYKKIINSNNKLIIMSDDECNLTIYDSYHNSGKLHDN
jgi:hypothetical protein